MNEKDQKHLDAVIRMYEKELKKCISIRALRAWCGKHNGNHGFGDFIPKEELLLWIKRKQKVKKR